MAKILLVEDDEAVAKAVIDQLSFARYVVDHANTFQEAVNFLSCSSYDLFILDGSLPDGDGFQICQQLRSKGENRPVLLLTGRTSIGEKSVGFSFGADDYLCKPFHTKELSLRVAALLRRGESPINEIFKFKEFELDSNRQTVKKSGVEIDLSPKEFLLFELLLRNVGKLVSHKMIEDKVWRSSDEFSHDAIKRLVGRLRAKVDKGSSLIENVHGVGYRLIE
ncbi:MAG: response regulator transcription factor [Candidatus Obscuribacter sp.]|nr:response regulator transcription factor [Candidatus Obscuribacter sp.]